MASLDRSKRKILKARKTMPISCQKQVEFLRKSNIEALKTAAIESNIPSGNQNLSTSVISSKCRHFGNIDSSLDPNKNSVFSQKGNVFSQNLIRPVEEIVDSETKLEHIYEQVACPYRKPRKTIDCPSRFSVQEAKSSCNTSDIHFKYHTNVSRFAFEHEENYNLKSVYYLPPVLNGAVQNILSNETINEMVSSLKANSNSESHAKRQNGILNSDSCFVPVEKTPNLVNSVSSSNCVTFLKTEESSSTCHSSISDCEHADSNCQSLFGTDGNSSHNQKKRMLSENKENVKHMKISEQINENVCVALERQTSLLEQVKHLIRQEIYNINYKLFDEKLNELNERIGKTQCRNKHKAIADELFLKVTRLQRHIRKVLSQRDCLEPNMLSSNAACKLANSETMNLGKNQESVNGPNEGTTSVNCEPFNPSEKANEGINSSPDCVDFVSESNSDDVILISVESPNLTTPITSTTTDVRKVASRTSNDSPDAIPEVQAVKKKKLDFVIDLTTEDVFNCSTESPAFTLKSPSKAVLNPKEITPVAKNGAEDFDSFEHLPPLPEPPPPLPELAGNFRDTLPPQKPELKVNRVLRPLGITLTWTITKINPKCAPVQSYHLFMCHENAKNKFIWNKIGEIRALPLPMACTLSQYLACKRYYFTLRSKDIFGRYGPFCDIECTPGFSKNLI